ncbi:MAG: membrane protein insertase YidC, partial [Gammaproteobacteria bacterium]|nr:membrane protein insertase YidC [Gammaproteobacteria bacterium]
MNMRSFWWLALAFTLTWMWLEWMQFTAQKVESTAAASAAQEVPIANNTTPSMSAASTAVGTDVPGANAGSVGNSAVPVVANGFSQGQRISVKTDTLDLVIDTVGGDIRVADLVEYGASVDHSQAYRLMSDSGPLVYIAQNGIATQANAALPAPT